MSIVNRTSVLRVIALEINEDGAVSKKQMKIDRDSQLENTLLQGGLSGYSCRHDRHPAAAA